MINKIIFYCICPLIIFIDLNNYYINYYFYVTDLFFEHLLMHLTKVTLH